MIFGNQNRRAAKGRLARDDKQPMSSQVTLWSPLRDEVPFGLTWTAAETSSRYATAQRVSASGRFQTILPCKGRWLAEGQTEGYPPLDGVTPLHHFVIPLPLQGRNLHPPLVVTGQSGSPAPLPFPTRAFSDLSCAMEQSPAPSALSPAKPHWRRFAVAWLSPHCRVGVARERRHRRVDMTQVARRRCADRPNTPECACNDAVNFQLSRRRRPLAPRPVRHKFRHAAFRHSDRSCRR